MDECEQLMESLVDLFRPVVEDVIHQELDRRLQEPVRSEQVDQWIEMISNISSIGRVKRVAYIARLKVLKFTSAQTNGRVALTRKERQKLIAEAIRRLPQHVVSVWMSALTTQAMSDEGVLRLCVFDEAMLPVGTPPLKLDSRFEAFGVDRGRIMDILKEVRSRLPPEERLPAAAVRHLEVGGITCQT